MNNMNFIYFIINVVTTMLCGAFLFVIPALTRKSLLFGVRVPEEAAEHPDANALKKNYFKMSIIGIVIILSLEAVQYILLPEYTILALLYFPLLIVAIQMLAYIVTWKKAIKLKEENNWRTSFAMFVETKSSHERGSLALLPKSYYAVSLAIILINGIISLNMYPSLPDSLPVHFDFDMNPDRWADKSITAVFFMSFINLLLLLIMFLSSIGVIKTKLQINTQNPALSFAQHRIYRKLMCHGIGIMTVSFVMGLSLLNYQTLYPGFILPPWLLWSVMLAPIVPIMIVVFKAGQGGCKLNPEITSADNLAAGYKPAPKSGGFGRDDDRFWLLGMFYYNPDDPSILVEDRFGVNIGFNYSRTAVKIAIAATLLLLAAVYLWLTVMLLPKL